MDTIKFILQPQYHESIGIMLHTEKENEFFDIPRGKEVVYNDNPYIFILPGINVPPTEVYINDEVCEVEFCGKSSDQLRFKLKINNSDKPFLHSYGAIKIEMEICGQQYYSNSITVLVSNTNINNSVMNMVQFIYENCEDYLYEEHKHSSVSTGIQDSETISLEAKIAFLENALKVYRQSYQYLKTNPYSKLEKREEVVSFNKLQTISSNTMRYVANHIDELSVVNYDTGIRFNNQYYQPNRILAERNYYSSDVYENRIVIGFLKTLVSEINITVKSLSERTYAKSKTTVTNGYIDSMYQIFSNSIKKISGYIETLNQLQKDYQQLYYFYSNLFNVYADIVRTPPIFTSVFRSINAYRQIYQIIHNWFSMGNYDLGKDELLLSFISTSKIYEYYCLVKLLRHINDNTDLELIESQRVIYSVHNRFFAETRYNNTFIFENNDTKLTLYFQPVIYGDDKKANGIALFRNTSTKAKTDNYNKGFIYNPDYLIKAERYGTTSYIILDAKFSTPENIRLHQLQELVYKYLFSISTLNKLDSILGLYILCGKQTGNDTHDIVHDIAHKISHTVTPFAEILVMNGVDTEDFAIPTEIIKKIM